MKETSIFVTMLTLVTLLPCQGMPTKTSKKTASLNTAQDNSDDKPRCNLNGVTEPPSFAVERKIYSERRYFLQMTLDGGINGTTEILYNTNIVFLLESVGDGGLFRAKGKETNTYLSMDKSGKFYGSKTPNSESVFKQISTTHGFVAIQSFKYCTKYIGMRRNGHLKRVDKPNHSSHFLFMI